MGKATDLFRTSRVVVGRLVAFGAIRRKGRVWFVCRGPLVVLRDDPRGSHVLQTIGVSQPNVAAAWLAAKRALGALTLVDVGANYGEIALLARYRRARCIAIEPNPKVAATLRSSAGRHRHGGSIEIVEAAATAGGDGGSAILFVDESWSGASSIDSGRDSGGVEVATSTVDDLVAAYGLEVDHGIVIKVDVEGGEAAVIRGSRDTLARSVRFALIVEVNPQEGPEHSEARERLLVELKALGRIYQLTSNGMLRGIEDFGRLTRKTDVVVLSAPPWRRATFRILTAFRSAIGG